MENNNFDLNLLDMSAVNETVEFYTTILKDEVKEFKSIRGYSPDNKESIIENVIKSVCYDNEGFLRFMDIMKDLVAENLVTKETMEIYIELITNEKLRNKIRFISDGSYYKYRIWANCLNCEKLALTVDCNKPIKEMVDNCQYVFLQIPYSLKKDLDTAKQWIELEILSKKLDFEDFEYGFDY